MFLWCRGNPIWYLLQTVRYPASLHPLHVGRLFVLQGHGRAEWTLLPTHKAVDTIHLRSRCVATLVFYSMAPHCRASFLHDDFLLYSIGVHQLMDFFLFSVFFLMLSEQSHIRSKDDPHHSTCVFLSTQSKNCLMTEFLGCSKLFQELFLSPNPPFLSQDQLPTLSDAWNGSGFTLAREVKASQKRPQGD